MSISGQASEARGKLDRAQGEIQRVKLLLEENQEALRGIDGEQLFVIFHSIDIVASEIKEVRAAL